jgi:hypothetical protein
MLAPKESLIETVREIDRRLPCITMLLFLIHDNNLRLTDNNILSQITRRVVHHLASSFVLLVKVRKSSPSELS